MANKDPPTVGRGALWSDAEVKALIKIWGEEKIQGELDGATRNKPVFLKIAEHGHYRDWEQCKSKLKKLKKDYRDTKDHNGKTGQGRKTCKFFNELEEILGHRPTSVPAILLDTGSSSSTVGEPADNEDEAQINGKLYLNNPN